MGPNRAPFYTLKMEVSFNFWAPKLKLAVYITFRHVRPSIEPHLESTLRRVSSQQRGDKFDGRAGPMARGRAPRGRAAPSFAIATVSELRHSVQNLTLKIWPHIKLATDNKGVIVVVLVAHRESEF